MNGVAANLPGEAQAVYVSGRAGQPYRGRGIGVFNRLSKADVGRSWELDALAVDVRGRPVDADSTHAAEPDSRIGR